MSLDNEIVSGASCCYHHFSRLEEVSYDPTKEFCKGSCSQRPPLTSVLGLLCALSNLEPNETLRSNHHKVIHCNHRRLKLPCGNHRHGPMTTCAVHILQMAYQRIPQSLVDACIQNNQVLTSICQRVQGLHLTTGAMPLAYLIPC